MSLELAADELESFTQAASYPSVCRRSSGSFVSAPFPQRYRGVPAECGGVEKMMASDR